MLTGRLVRVRYSRQRIIPCWIDTAEAQWHEVAERLLDLFRGSQGKSRGELEEELRESFGSDPKQIVHQGLAKLLDDRCEFEVVSGHAPERIRELVFAAAGRWRTGPPTPPAAEASPIRMPAFDQSLVLQQVAGELGMSTSEVEQGLFADLKSEQRLVKFKDISAERLLERYNVSLAQAVLLRSTRVKVLVRNEPPQRHRQLLRLVKFHRLICDIERTAPGELCLRLDGPLSLFSATQKYGLQLALFLPAILPCRDFELQAELLWGPQRKPKTFALTQADGLVAPHGDQGMYVPPELAMFVQLFRKKVDNWEIEEATDILPLGDSFWVPDYQLKHRVTGRTVYVEVLGFWRRASVEKHLQRLREHARQPFVLAVSEQMHIDDAELEGLPAEVHRFRQMPLPDEIARLAEKCSEAVNR